MEKPKFDINPVIAKRSEIDRLNGHFFNLEELPDQFRVVAENVGKVCTYQGEHVGTAFTVDATGQRYLVSALHCFRDCCVVERGRFIAFPSGEKIFLPRSLEQINLEKVYPRNQWSSEICDYVCSANCSYGMKTSDIDLFVMPVNGSSLKTKPLSLSLSLRGRNPGYLKWL